MAPKTTTTTTTATMRVEDGGRPGFAPPVEEEEGGEEGEGGAEEGPDDEEEGEGVGGEAGEDDDGADDGAGAGAVVLSTAGAGGEGPTGGAVEEMARMHCEGSGPRQPALGTHSELHGWQVPDGSTYCWAVQRATHVTTVPEISLKFLQLFALQAAGPGPVQPVMHCSSQA